MRLLPAVPLTLVQVARGAVRITAGQKGFVAAVLPVRHALPLGLRRRAAGPHRLITEVRAPHRHAATPTTTTAAAVHILLLRAHPAALALLPVSRPAAVPVPATPVVEVPVVPVAAVVPEDVKV